MKAKKEKKGEKKSKKQVSHHLIDNAGVEANAQRFTNRELSWLDFNERVLFEARDTKNPLLERARFLGITASNLDEFYVIRVASLKDLVNAKSKHRDFAGLNAKEQLALISEKIRKTMALQYSTYNRSLLPALKSQGIQILDYDELGLEQKEMADEYFHSTLYPILTPTAVDAARPFPLLHSQSLNMAVLIEEEEDEEVDYRYATLRIPAVVPRLYRMADGDESVFIPIERLIEANLQALFPGSKILASAVYRIMRNADLDIDEDEAADLLKEIEEQVRMRQWGEIIRLEAEDTIDERLLRWITESLEIDREDTFDVNGPLDLTFLFKLVGSLSDDMPEQCHPPYKAQWPAMLGSGNIFEEIQKKDILLHHPYESFDPVVDFVKAAASDPDVLAIKQTLYRVSSRSPIIRYLAEAAMNGKQVMVLVELKARFDEENNINWAKMLEKAGCHVIYGLVGLKTHSKITLVVRNDEDRIRRYLHLGTGNYNDSTARVYTDLGLFTCAEPFGIDATEFFNMLSGYAEPAAWKKLVVAPRWLRGFFIKSIKNEIQNAREGKGAAIVAKMNSLVDGELIELLYEASAAGVKIDLIVRGICCLRAGVKGLSENITVRSIIGRFLEHSRIFYFYNEGAEDVYLGSADWMPRNLDRRIELMFPVEDVECKRRVMEILELEIEDTLRSHLQQADGSYHRQDLRGKMKLDSQQELCEMAIRAARSIHEDANLTAFMPEGGYVDPTLASDSDLDDR